MSQEQNVAIPRIFFIEADRSLSQFFQVLSSCGSTTTTTTWQNNLRATGCVPVALDVQVLSIQRNCSSCIRNISSSTPSLSPSMPFSIPVEVCRSPGVDCLEGWDLSRSFLRRFCSARDRRPLEVSWDA